MSHPWSSSGKFSDQSPYSNRDRSQHQKRHESELMPQPFRSERSIRQSPPSSVRRGSASQSQRPNLNYAAEGSQAALRKAGQISSGPNVPRYFPTAGTAEYSSSTRNAQSDQSYAQATSTRGIVDTSISTLDRTDHATGVKSTVVTGESSRITAPDLQKQGITNTDKSLTESRKVELGTTRDDQVALKYKIRSKGKNGFQVGNVIELRWVEPRARATTLTHLRNDVGDTRIRRYVIIREGQTHSAVLPISTYGGRGVAAPDVVKAHHAVIHTSSEPPALLPGEGPTRVGSQVDSLRAAIRVKARDRETKLDERSRLNFAKIDQIYHAECEIHVFGTVAEESMASFLYQFEAVQQSLHQSFQGSNITGAGFQHQRRDDQGNPGPSHGRVDSVQRPTPRNAPKRSTHEDEDEDEDDSDAEETPSRRPQYTPTASASSEGVGALTQQMTRLGLRAQQFGTSLAHLNMQERLNLVQMSDSDQGRSLLQILHQQNPQRYAQVMRSVQQRQSAISAARQSNDESADSDDNDSDDDSDDSE